MFGDRDRQAVAKSLFALQRIGHRTLGGALGDADALKADIQPRIVHHGEHRGHAAHFRPDQPTDRTVMIAIAHDAGRRRVDTELMLDRNAADVVRRPIRHQLRNEE